MFSRGLEARYAALAAIAVGIVAATPAQADSTAFSPGVFSKSEAIIGAPSALEAILAQQHAIPPQRQSLQPASFSIPRVAPTNAVLSVAPTSAVLNVGTESAPSGRPDLFGSVALRVNHTPLDAKWHAAANAPVTGEAERYGETLRDLAPVERLKLVNRYVNRRVRYASDQSQFGETDVWSAANDTLRRGRGDCEDYAIAKLQILRRAGFSSRDLYLTIVHDLVRRADHAVLVARAAGEMFVLDDGTDEILASDRVSDYRPVLTFASNGEWTHGYRVTPPVMQAPATILASGSSDQRSRSASLLAFNSGFNR
jgi:predicted transglutaminase-like cysteine proteinase